jgi:16S rRNA (guanine527-N7)-methyltransferase
LAEWGARINLTGAKTPEARVVTLIEPALRLRPWLVPGGLLDLGSGNGSPGLVLALVEPGRVARLLEPRGRRWAFLREAARRCGREEILVLRNRHDEYQGAPAENVLLRGLRLPLAELDRLIAVGGQALLSGRPGLRAEPVPGQLGVYRYRPGERST